MMNERDRQKSTWVRHREYKDTDGNIHTEYKDTRGNMHTEYRDAQGNIHTEHKDAQGNIQFHENGYIDSHLVPEKIQDIEVEQPDRNISKGMLIGVIVTCVVGLTAGTIYFLTQQNTPQPVSIIAVPTSKSLLAPKSSPSQIRVVEQPTVTLVPLPPPQADGSPEPIATQPSATTPSAKQGGINPAKPANNSSASVPRPTAAVPAKSNVISPDRSKADSDLKNEILRQLEDNLPDNQLVVEVKNGEVTISGMAATPEQLRQIQPLLKLIQGIGKVHMAATVAPKM